MWFLYLYLEIYTAFTFALTFMKISWMYKESPIQVEILIDYINVVLSLAVGIHTKKKKKIACAKGIISWGEKAVHTIAALLFQRWEVCTLIWSWESRRILVTQVLLMFNETDGTVCAIVTFTPVLVKHRIISLMWEPASEKTFWINF